LLSIGLEMRLQFNASGRKIFEDTIFSW